MTDDNIMENLCLDFSTQKKNEFQDAIKQLSIKYNLHLDDKHLKRLSFISFSQKIEQKPNSLNFLESKRKLADLDMILRNVIKSQSEFTISTTIKSIKSSVTLESGIANELLLYVDSLIEILSDGFYQYNFDWEFKQPIINSYISGLTEPYTDEEIAQIIDHEANEAVLRKNLNKKSLGLKINKITAYLREEGIFSLDYDTISTPEACFLFDTLVVLNVIGSDESYNNQDKYQFIKGKLKQSK